MNILDTRFCSNGIVPCPDTSGLRLIKVQQPSFNYLITPLCATAEASAQALGDGAYEKILS
jgi:hypothetical protein